MQILLQEAAIAFLIALVVKEMIESEYERRQQVAMVAGAEASRHAVLRALFGTFFDDETVERVYGTIFSSPLVREDLHVAYRFSPHPKSAWLVVLEVTLNYKIKNAGTTVTHFDPHVVVANYAALFQLDRNLSTPALRSAKIGDQTLSSAEINALNAAITRTENPVTFTFDGRPMKAGQSIDVEIAYEREKLACDAEILTMSYPTKKVTLLVESDCGAGMEFDVRGIGQQSLSTPDSGGTPGAALERVNDGILVKDNGWVLFWNDTLLRPTEIRGPRPGSPASA